MSSVAVAAGTTNTHRRHVNEHRFYAAVCVLAVGVSIAGFGPAILSPAGRAVPLPMTMVVAVHAVAASAWLALFLLQVTLVSTGRVALHRRLGLTGVVLAIVFVISGCLASVAEARRGFDLSGDLVPAGATAEAWFVLAPINGFVLFAVMFGMALWYRRRPDVHKRLMALTVLGAMLGAPIAHLVGHYPVLQAGGGALAPLANAAFLSLSAIHDRWAYGRVHPASRWGGLGAFAWLFVFFTFIAPTPAWRAFTEWLIR